MKQQGSSKTKPDWAYDLAIELRDLVSTNPKTDSVEAELEHEALAQVLRRHFGQREAYRKRLCDSLHLPDDDGWDPIVNFVDQLAKAHAKLMTENSTLNYFRIVFEREIIPVAENVKEEIARMK
jgi:hypothetical protein